MACRWCRIPVYPLNPPNNAIATCASGTSLPFQMWCHSPVTFIMNPSLALGDITKQLMKQAPFLWYYSFILLELFPSIPASILSIKSLIASILIAWPGLAFFPNCSLTPLTKRSGQIVFVVHLVRNQFLLSYSPMDIISINPSAYEFYTVEKSDLELLNVSNCGKISCRPGSNHLIIMSTAVPTPKITFYGRGINWRK